MCCFRGAGALFYSLVKPYPFHEDDVLFFQFCIGQRMKHVLFDQFFIAFKRYNVSAKNILVSRLLRTRKKKNSNSLRRFQYNAWHRIAQNIMRDRTHVTIVFDNERFLIVRIFHHQERNICLPQSVTLNKTKKNSRVNLTSIRSLAFNGFCDTGHRIVGSGFSDLLIFAAGVWLGTQKLGSSFSFPFAMFDIVDALLLVPGWSDRFTETRKKNQN